MPSMCMPVKSLYRGAYALCLVSLMLLLVLLLPPLALALPIDDATALLGFLSGIDKDPTASLTSTWKEENVDSFGCPSGWYGVTCSDGRVTGLFLGGLNLSGGIRKGTLGAMSKLSSLYLLNNQLTGVLADDLGSLALLQQLDLSNNLLHGSISSFSTLTNLVNLTIAGNKFDGLIPDMFEKMSSLVAVDLSMNSLSGAIPPSLTLLPNLISLNLSCNSLTGLLPKSLEMLQDLEIFDLHSNQLSGSIDPAWINLAKIQTLDFSSNGFLGQLPWHQINPVISSIIHVNLSCNQLSGQLAPPNAASIFANQLQVLDVSRNQLSGELPSFEFAFSLRVLRLQNNFFTGSVPRALLSSDAALLEDLDLSMNNLSGKLAPIKESSLQTLNLSSNALSGELPTKLGTCAVVDLSNNLFSGNLLGMRTWSNSLEVLDLSSNFLTGDLPNQTAELLRLFSFNLSHNSLSGVIPPTFGYFRKLTILDLSANQLFGGIPASFFQSPSLTALRLSNNQLSGSISLDDALASGSIPSRNVFPIHGLSHATTSLVLSPLTVLDLSWNAFNGSIPQGIGSLEMLELLDLSRNMLTGTMPSLSQLYHLQTLDLSFNQLSGAIPVQMPVSLLGFNVSNNNLSGQIPSTLQHKFPMSSFFPGNTGLRASAGAFNSSSPSYYFPDILQRAHHRSITPAVKSGLIGGCTAGMILFLIAIVIVFYKQKLRPPKTAKTSLFRVIEKGLDQSDGTGSVERHGLSSQDDSHISSSVTMGFSGGQVYSPTKDTDVDQPKAAAKSQESLFKSLEVRKRTTPIGMSPSKPQSMGVLQSMPKELTSVTADNPVVLKVESPDMLAGDLFLLDSSINFTAEELSRAPAEVLGRSSHGTTYNATMTNGHSVTVKWLREELAKSKKDFLNEAKRLGSLKHQNIMPLKGFYWGPREHEKLLITDFINSGSLDSHLSDKNGQMLSSLEWSQRLHIAVDIARGLTYLHLEHRLPHGNLKSTNVLLDGPNLKGRLTDYCLYRLMTVVGAANQIVNAGALGYLAPELASSSNPKPSLSADMYAFGVILLAILSGKGAGDIIFENSGAVSLADWVKLLASEGKSANCFDSSLIGSDKDNDTSKGLHEVLELALRCLSPAETRPNIRTVYEELVSIDSNA